MWSPVNGTLKTGVRKGLGNVININMYTKSSFVYYAAILGHVFRQLGAYISGKPPTSFSLRF